MKVQHLNPAGVPDWSATFSQVVVVEHESLRHLYVSGQVGVDERKILARDGGFDAQLDGALSNLKVVLGSGGASWGDVVKLSVFVVNYQPAHGASISRALASRFPPGQLPALSLLGVTALPDPAFLVEVEAIAVVRASSATGPTPEERDLLRHFLAALAYRTQKALRDAPESFAQFCAPPRVRTPHELVRHMTSVLGYATTFFLGGSYRAAPLPDFFAEVARFHNMVARLADLVAGPSAWPEITPQQLLQGPLADAMTHAGQLAMLRRLAGHPVPPENFVFAKVSADNLGPDQPSPVAPDEVWPEAP